MHRGFIKIWRKIEDSGIADDYRLLGFAVWLVLKAQWKTTKMNMNGQITTVKRGQLVTGRNKLAQKIGASPQRVRTMLQSLRNSQFLTSRSTNKYTTITICKYDEYQDSNSDANQQNNQRPTSTQPAPNQHPTTFKEGKKEKKEKKVFKYSDKFETWYKSYPRREAKGSAYKAWQTLNSEEMGLATTAIKAQSKALMEREPKFIPLPASWLNSRSFENENINSFDHKLKILKEAIDADPR